MADIKQAAKWLQKGKLVRRASWKQKEAMQDTQIGLIMVRGHSHPVFVTLKPESLLARDWEIAE